LGATGIEDKLAEEVTETITAFKDAGIKVKIQKFKNYFKIDLDFNRWQERDCH